MLKQILLSMGLYSDFDVQERVNNSKRRPTPREPWPAAQRRTGRKKLSMAQIEQRPKPTRRQVTPLLDRPSPLCSRLAKEQHGKGGERQ